MDLSGIESPSTPLSRPGSSVTSTFELKLTTRVRVVCRIRPLSQPEVSRETRVVLVLDDKTLSVQENKHQNIFTFDSVYDGNSSQEDIYYSVGKKTLAEFFKGFNGTILAYGQTGAGKSYTMTGVDDVDSIHRGLIPRIAEDIFTNIAESLSNVEYTVGISMMEVYKEHIIDLLNPLPKSKEYTIHEDKTNGVHVRGLSLNFVSSALEMSSVLRQGVRARKTASTDMNTESSRSHAISQIILTQKDVITGEITKSHLFLVDLAGSEKVDRSGASGVTLEETKKINLSLSVLGLVINSLTEPKSTHIPYRDSKLTRILQESLGGNSRTTLIINISPSSGSYSETLSTLRFGSRAKKIRNSIHINTELSIDQLKAKIVLLEKQNKELEDELFFYRSPNTKHEHNIKIQSLSSSSPLVTKKGSNSSFHEQGQSLLPALSGDPLVALQDELRRKDEKIGELEQELLELKMASLTSLHNEDLKLFKLECALYKLNDKLSDVELINTNLRRHLQLSEKIIKARGNKIDKLRELVSEQQEQVNRESSHFESKLKILKDRFDSQKLRQREQFDNGKPGEDSPFNDEAPEIDLDNDLDRTQTFQRTPERHAIRSSHSRHDSQNSPKMGLNLRIVKPLRGGMAPTD